MVSNSASAPEAFSSMVASEDMGLWVEGYERSARRSVVRVELARDHDALDLGCAFVNLGYLRVAEQTLDGILLHVAIAAEDLHGLGRDPHRGLARHQLAHRAESRDHLAAILGGGGGVQERPRRGDARRHVGELELDRLVIANRLAELPSLSRVLAGQLQRRAGDAERLRRDAEPPVVQRL